MVNCKHNVLVVFAAGRTIEEVFAHAVILDDGRTLCKVYPSPGSARSVWALPQTSCSMVADTDHPTAAVTRDSNLSEADIADQTQKSIFDVVKTG